MIKKQRRTTIKVKELVEIVNQHLANPNLSQEEKKGICLLIERILLDTNNYRGFTHITWVTGGAEKWFKAEKEGRVREDDYKAKQEYIGPEYNRIYYY